MTMKVTVDFDNKVVKLIEDKINEKLPEIVNEVLLDNMDSVLKDVVIKQLRGCALLYFQSSDFRSKIMQKIKLNVDSMLGVDQCK